MNKLLLMPDILKRWEGREGIHKNCNTCLHNIKKFPKLFGYHMYQTNLLKLITYLGGHFQFEGSCLSLHLGILFSIIFCWWIHSLLFSLFGKSNNWMLDLVNWSSKALVSFLNFYSYVCIYYSFLPRGKFLRASTFSMETDEWEEALSSSQNSN